MQKSLMRWMHSQERVHYTEPDVPSLVDKPLDPQGATIWRDDEPAAKGGIRTLISTADLPKNPKPGENYQIRDVHWIFVNGEWMSRQGIYGH